LRAAKGNCRVNKDYLKNKRCAYFTIYEQKMQLKIHKFQNYVKIMQKCLIFSLILQNVFKKLSKMPPIGDAFDACF